MEARRGPNFSSNAAQRAIRDRQFWGGVDLPGEALSNVIIARLPFAVPDTPLIEAKLQLVQEGGDDAFTEFSLPETIPKLRQDVGRLIQLKPIAASW